MEEAIIVLGNALTVNEFINDSPAFLNLSFSFKPSENIFRNSVLAAIPAILEIPALAIRKKARSSKAIIS